MLFAPHKRPLAGWIRTNVAMHKPTSARHHHCPKSSLPQSMGAARTRSLAAGGYVPHPAGETVCRRLGTCSWTDLHDFIHSVSLPPGCCCCCCHSTGCDDQCDCGGTARGALVAIRAGGSAKLRVWMRGCRTRHPLHQKLSKRRALHRP